MSTATTPGRRCPPLPPPPPIGTVEEPSSSPSSSTGRADVIIPAAGGGEEAASEEQAVEPTLQKAGNDPRRHRRPTAPHPSSSSSSPCSPAARSTPPNPFELEQVGNIMVSSPETASSSMSSSANSSSSPYPSWFVIHVTAVASLGGILFGYDLGVISGALPLLTETFDLTRRQQETCVSVLYLGGGLGAAVGGSVCDGFGRKRAIVVTDVIFAMGGLILYLAGSYEMIVVGRVVVGFAVALSGIADVTYLHEIAPVRLRGAIVSVNEACISLGFLLAFFVGTMLSNSTSGWRTMFGLSGLVAIVQLLGMLQLPESPTWLQQRGYHQEAEAVFRKINQIPEPSSSSTTFSPPAPHHAGPTIPSHFIETYQPSSSPSVVPTTDPSDFQLSSLVVLPSSHRISIFLARCVYLLKQYGIFITSLLQDYRRQAIVALFLAVTQQLCGQSNVLSYAATILAAASSNTGDGGDEDEQRQRQQALVDWWSTISIGIVKFIVTVIVIWKVESLGRRYLLLVGMAIIAFGLLLLALSFVGADIVNTENGSPNVQDGTNGLYLALPGILLVVCGYSMSFGPLTWLITSELFPTEIRGKALGLSTIATYLFASFVTYTFLTAEATFGATLVFSTYLLITCCGIAFALLAVPDTGGKNADEIETDLLKMPWWRIDNEYDVDCADNDKTRNGEYRPATPPRRNLTIPNIT